MFWQLITITIFYTAIFFVGVGAGRKMRGDKSSAGLLLAGRGMPIWIGVFTMTATWVGGAYINGTAEAVYDPNVGIFWTLAPIGYALSLVVGGLVFVRPMRDMQFTTLLDPFERRYGKQIAAGLFLPALVGEVFWSATILVALGTTFGTILGFNTTTSILISAAVAIGYTMVGGLWSVAYTDVVQLFCILIGLGLAAPFVISAVGGAETVFDHYVATTPSFPTGPRLWDWLDVFLMLIFGGIPWQVYFQRVLSARNSHIAVRLSLYAALGCLLLSVAPIVIGAAGVSATWPTAEMPAGSVDANGTLTEPKLVLPYLLQYLTPTVIATIGLGAVAAAVMSSVDSSILSASSMFVWNVYRPFTRHDAKGGEMRWVLRCSILVVGVLATWLALTVGSVYVLWVLCADFVYVVLFPQLVAVLFFRNVNRTGVVTGAIVSLGFRLAAGEPGIGLPALLPFQDYHIAFRTLAMLSGFATICLVSYVTMRCDPIRDIPISAK